MNEEAKMNQRLEALVESNRRFDLALAAVGAGAWEWDIKTGQTSWSEGNYALLGLPVGSGIASFEDWFARVHPEDRDRATIDDPSLSSGEE
jgi:PAS domain-containing protein